MPPVPHSFSTESLHTDLRNIIRLAQTALAVKVAEVEFLRLDAEVDGEVIFDQTQLFHLLIHKVHGAGVSAQDLLYNIITHASQPTCNIPS